MNLKISLGSLLVMNGGCLSFSNAYMISHEKMMRKIENLGGVGGGVWKGFLNFYWATSHQMIIFNILCT